MRQNRITPFARIPGSSETRGSINSRPLEAGFAPVGTPKPD